jgi:ABC-2 type transport system ATP-binding protein
MLTLENVRKQYGDLVAVDGLSLTVRPGEVLGLLGPNGAGKSTTVNLAVGLMAPTSGRITVDGKDPRQPETRRLLGVAPQALALYDMLSGRANDRVGTYSGGMKRRLNLAAALVHDPQLILLDEPTVGVDPQSRNQIFENILALKQLGRTLIYTTHYMEEAERLCDRIAVIDKGKLLALGTVDELLTAHGLAPKEVVRIERGTIEQVFLQLTGRSLRD